jgi:hypothetical protein
MELTNIEPPSWASVADKTAEVFEELLRRSLRYRPAWRKRPQLALVGVPAKLATALGPLASLDEFSGVSEVPTEEPRETPALPDGEDKTISYAALSSLDRWRGGYDAIITWVPSQPRTTHAGPASPAGTSVGAVEELARAWPGRTMAVVDESMDGAGGNAPVLPVARQLEKAGITVLPVSEATDWDDIARRVADAARAAAV